MRREVKRVLARIDGRGHATGATLLIYHRVGGGSPDELDVAESDFAAQVDVLAQHDVLSLDDALDRLERGDHTPCTVLTFDDGFEDVYHHAWPLLRAARIPFTLYLATGFLGGTMRWDGSTAKSTGPALSWRQVEEMVASGLATAGAHTHRHVRPELLTGAELDDCDTAIEVRLGSRPRHFTYPWGLVAQHMEADLRRRYRSTSTGELGRNRPGQDFARLKRVPVRRTDPLRFFRAKVSGSLAAERAYAGMVATAKRGGLRA